MDNAYNDNKDINNDRMESMKKSSEIDNKNDNDTVGC